MPSPSCPSSVIDHSHPQSASPHGQLSLVDVAEPDEEEEEEEEEYAARLYLPVTHGKGNLLYYLPRDCLTSPGNLKWNLTDVLGLFILLQKTKQYSFWIIFIGNINDEHLYRM